MEKGVRECLEAGNFPCPSTTFQIKEPSQQHCYAMPALRGDADDEMQRSGWGGGDLNAVSFLQCRLK